MKLLKTVSLFVFITFLSYANNKTFELADNEVIFWVNSTTKDRVGVAPTECLEVQEAEELNPEKWTLFYSAIEGFDFEEGYIYKLVVKKEKHSEKIPADASSIRYTLVDQLEKNKF